MKITVFLWLLGLIHCYAASSYGQGARLSLKMSNSSIEQIIEQIEEKTDLHFFYKSEDLEGTERFDVDVQEEKVFDLLDEILPEADLSYEVYDKYIAIRKTQEADADKYKMQQDGKVSGKVTDSNGQPLPGVSVIVKGTTQGTITDFDGNYFLDKVSSDAILVYSFIGMKSQDVPIKGKTSINVVMEEEAIGLEEVVAIGYGSMKKADLTGSVSSVTGDDLATINSSSVATAISGKLPGLQVTQTSGEPGASSVIRMRGVGSVYSGTDPLVLIDGFAGDLSQISASDVESISVLKDAASASIYGSRAANGVILVTTKSGKANQKLKIEMNAKYGIQKPTNIPEILDSKEWCKKMNESTLASSGIEYWTGDQAPEKQITNANWLDYIFRNDAPVQEHSISASGGANKMRYSVNIGYYDQEGIMINQGYNKYHFRSSLDYISDSFSMGAKLYKLRSTNKSNISATDNVLYNAFRTPPTIPVYNSDGLPGTPREGVTGEDVLMDNTPSMDAISRQYKMITNLSVANLYAEKKLLKGLKFKSIFNYKTTDTYATNFSPEWYSYRPTDIDHQTVFMGNSEAELECTSTSSYSWETQNLLTYNLDVNLHHFDLLAGYSVQKSESSNLFAAGTGFLRNSLQSLNAASSIQDIAGSTSESSIISQFGRFNYNFSDKYLLQFNLRRDGSSVFAPGNRWSIFPSLSAGWRVSEEDFMKQFDFVDNMKIRAGVGSLGNANIPSGQWYASVTFNSDYVLGTDQQLLNGSAVGAYNEGISWEKTTTYNLGVDMTMFRNKLDISFEAYKRKTTDMLLVLPLPATTGYSSAPYVNLGGVDNIGWEFTGQYQNKFRDLSYNIGFNISHVENEVVDMGGLSPIIETYTRTEEGHPINSYYGYVVEGIYQNESDILNNPSFEGAQPGDFKYKDISGDGKIDEEDQQYLGDAIPSFFFGGNIGLQYKGFDLSLFFQGEFDKKIMMTPHYGMDFGALYDYANMYKEVYDNRWKGEGDNSKYPALGSGKRTINNDCNTTWLQDASYIRMKNFQIGYTLPKSLVSKANIEKVRVFFTGTNLITFTKYIGFDPEMGTRQKRSDGTGMYMDKVYTYGGCDYPQAKNMQVGINIIF